MLTQKQLRIFGFLGRNIFRECTFTELKQLSEESSHASLQGALLAFQAEGLVTSRKIGTSRLYKVNTQNDAAYDYLKLQAVEQLPQVVRNCLSLIRAELNRDELFYALIIFGSYADGSFTPSSDLDLAILAAHPEKAKVSMNAASNRTLLPLDYQIFTPEEFQELLLADYDNVGKQVVAKHLPVFNPTAFYSVVQRAIRCGFNPVP